MGRRSRRLADLERRVGEAEANLLELGEAFVTVITANLQAAAATPVAPENLEAELGNRFLHRRHLT